MAKKFFLFFLLVIIQLSSYHAFSQQRFPRPEFESGYEQPDTTTPEPRSAQLEYFDVAILLLVLSLATYFALRSRSRKGILWLSVFTLLYFGFFREGCICAIGSVQNVSLSLFSTEYAVSWTVLAFFTLPLLFTLFFGRIFCAGACPLGVIQDLVVIRPIKIPVGLQKALGIFPYVYLGFAILYAVTGTDFIICRYDPFVGIFRMGAEFHMIVLGISFLLIGMFVGRPYCRFVCPYGVLLNWFSRFSKYHLSITPSKCIQCKLCSTSCPFDAIEAPTGGEEQNQMSTRKFLVYFALIPVLIVAGGYLLSESHALLAKVHPKVYLADLLIEHPEMRNNTENLDIETFMASGQSLQSLAGEAKTIRNEFYRGGWLLGGFLGLVIGIFLLSQQIFRRKEDYHPHKGNCYSCGRCMDYCPVPE
jgi:polyferredoxin